MVEKKRLFDKLKFLEEYMKGGNYLKDFIDSEIRRNLKEFAVEIKRPVMEGYMDIEYALDSALKKRGIDL